MSSVFFLWTQFYLIYQIFQFMKFRAQSSITCEYSSYFKTIRYVHKICNENGFRNYWQTKDNILVIFQRKFEAFNRKKKNCVIFFDIAKAFEKVWNNGILLKLRNYNYKVVLIKEFLSNRFLK